MWEAITEFFTTQVSSVMALVMLAALALVIGAVVLYRRTGEAKQPILMVILALIAVGNVLILTIPTADGTAPIDQASIDETETTETR
jgi:hypothetical protein